MRGNGKHRLSAPSQPTLRAALDLFGKRMKQLREERGVSVSALAEALGMDRSSPSAIERGRHAPSFRTIGALAQFLMVDEKDLLTFPELGIRHVVDEECRGAPKDVLEGTNAYLKDLLRSEPWYLPEGVGLDSALISRKPMPSTQDLFGARLRFLREARGIKKARLATAVNLDPRSLNAIEIGREAPSFRSIVHLAAVLAVDEKDLLTFPGRSMRHDLGELCRRASPGVLLLVRSYMEAHGRREAAVRHE